MMKFAILVVALLTMFALPAQAQQDFPRSIDVSWTNADSYVDNTLIEPGDLENIRIEIYRQGETIPVFTATVPATGEGLAQLESFADAIPKPGTYRIEGYSIVVGGIESDPSASLFKKYVGKPRSVVLRSIE